MTNNLAYYDTNLITGVKSFKVLATCQLSITLVGFSLREKNFSFYILIQQHVLDTYAEKQQS